MVEFVCIGSICVDIIANMMSDHDSIIKLLNGYLNRSDNDDSNANDVFLDRHGQPTDRFLEVYHSLNIIIAIIIIRRH